MPDPELKPVVILNRESRRGASWLPLVGSIVAPFAERIHLPRNKNEFRAAVRRAVAENQSHIWVGGGDGTIRQAASEIVSTNSCLGILPLGTGNALATELGIPVNPQTMVNFLCTEAKERLIDVGQFNSEVFVNVVSLGLTVGIAKELKSHNKKLLGKFAYLPAVAGALLQTRGVPARVKANGESVQGRVLQFVAASTRLHGGPFPVTPQSSISDGLLSFYVVRPVESAPFWKYGLALAFGQHTQLENVWGAESQEIEIELGRIRQFVIDGDLIRAKSAKIKILPGSLRVLAREAEPESSPTQEPEAKS